MPLGRKVLVGSSTVALQVSCNLAQLPGEFRLIQVKSLRITMVGAEPSHPAGKVDKPFREDRLLLRWGVHQRTPCLSSIKATAALAEAGPAIGERGASASADAPLGA